MESATNLKRYRKKAIESATQDMVEMAWSYLEEKVAKGTPEFFENQCIRIDKEELDSRMERTLAWAEYPHFADIIRKEAKRLLRENLSEQGWRLMAIGEGKCWALCPLPIIGEDNK